MGRAILPTNFAIFRPSTSTLGLSRAHDDLTFITLKKSYQDLMTMHTTDLRLFRKVLYANEEKKNEEWNKQSIEEPDINKLDVRCCGQLGGDRSLQSVHDQHGGNG